MSIFPARARPISSVSSFVSFSSTTPLSARNTDDRPESKRSSGGFHSYFSPGSPPPSSPGGRKMPSVRAPSRSPSLPPTTDRALSAPTTDRAESVASRAFVDPASSSRGGRGGASVRGSGEMDEARCFMRLRRFTAPTRRRCSRSMKCFSNPPIRKLWLVAKTFAWQILSTTASQTSKGTGSLPQRRSTCFISLSLRPRDRTALRSSCWSSTPSLSSSAEKNASSSVRRLFMPLSSDVTRQRLTVTMETMSVRSAVAKELR
mmetsp:Transcript_35613/g.120656  ORF Transcript_35613/g.120656 Transcript_35613/m.120656 type:complete len:261 (-) Transcript_35613:284-1066(-)